MDYTPKVLRNRGVPVLVAALTEAGQRIEVEGYEPEPGSAPGDGYQTETWYVKFNYATLEALEDQWDTVEAWQQAMAETPITTVRRTLSILWKAEPPVVRERMLPGALSMYSGAIGAAWAIAHGVDPFVIAEGLRKAEASRAEVAALITEAATTMLGIAPTSPDGATDTAS